MGDDLLADRRLVALQYYARLPPRHDLFQWPVSRPLLSIQGYLVEDLGLHRNLNDSIDYKRAFLKHIIGLLQISVDAEPDSSEAEICGELLEVFAHFMAVSKGASTSTTQRVSYYYPSAEAGQGSVREPSLFEGWNCITVEDDIRIISKGTTGLKTWEASLRLAAHLTARPDIFAREDMTILELGSGSGFLGTVLANLAFDKDIHLTDRDGIVLDLLRTNIRTNVADAQKVTVAPLDWLEVQDDSGDSPRYLASLQPNLVIASDTIYDPTNIDAFCQVLKTALSWSRGPNDAAPYALLARPIRNEQTQALFLEAVDRHYLAVQIEPMQLPRVDLHTGKLSSAGPLALFPSVYDETKGEAIQLYHVSVKT